jgi:protein KRI1
LAKKKEEVRILKALKMREVRRKLEIIGRQAGLKGKGKGKEEGLADDEDDGVIDEALRELDLEGDWSPEKHDRQMAGLFDRDADAFEDDGGGRDEDSLTFDADGKPVWDDDIDIGDIAMPEDDAVEARPNRKEGRKKKKKKKKGQENDDNAVDVDAMDADAEPIFQDDEEWDGTEEMRKSVLKKYMDQLDGLDFNDMVG